jgi:hypothetical protein
LAALLSHRARRSRLSRCPLMFIRRRSTAARSFSRMPSRHVFTKVREQVSGLWSDDGQPGQNARERLVALNEIS